MKRTSTCSLDQLSMLSDFTLDMWVPSLRWMVAHRMHRKMPSYNTSCLVSFYGRVAEGLGLLELGYQMFSI